jgi:membrane-associated phospholipid phosphatase
VIKQVALFISWIFQPILMPIYGTLILFNLPYYGFNLLNENVFYYVIVSIFLFTIALPGSLILMLKKMNFITSIHLNERSERKYPILFTIFFHLANYYFLSNIHLPFIYYVFLLSGIFSLIITFLISNFWKISMHTTGIGGLCGVFFACILVWGIDTRLILAVLFIIAGLIGSARVVLKAHTAAQVYAGFVAGMIPQTIPLFLIMFGWL